MKRILLSILTTTAFSFGANAQDSTAFIASDGALNLSNKKYANIPTPSGSNLRLTGDWTVELWVKILSSSSQIHLIETYTTSNTGGFALRIWNSKIRGYQIVNGSNNNVNVIGNTTLTQGVWHHVAATLNETTNELKVYVNGALDGTTACNLNTFNNNNSLRIGARGDDANVNGEVLLDEVRIWDYARTQSEIQTDKASCLTGSETNLLALYDFEGTPNATLSDQSTNGNDGTFVNFDAFNFGYGAYSCGAPTGITEINNSTLRISPNPAKDVLTIHSENSIEKVSIYSTNGSLVKDYNFSNQNINISDLSKGMYVLVLQSDQGIKQRKFIKE